MDLKVGDIVRIDTCQLKLSWSNSDNGYLPDHGKLGLVAKIIKPQGLSTSFFYSILVENRQIILHRKELIKHELDK